MRKSNAGFTIIEIIVTVGVASIFLLASYILMIGSIASARQARNRTTASNLATQKIEELRSEDYESINSADFDETVDPSVGPAFTINVTVVEKTSTIPTLSKRKEITVRVTWDDPKSNEFISETSVTPHTLITRPV